jgi:hypothetical protein
MITLLVALAFAAPYGGPEEWESGDGWHFPTTLTELCQDILVTFICVLLLLLVWLAFRYPGKARNILRIAAIVLGVTILRLIFKRYF